jgi:hypothetical protein
LAASLVLICGVPEMRTDEADVPGGDLGIHGLDVHIEERRRLLHGEHLI